LRYAGPDQQRYKAEELLEAGAILLGRVTDEIVAAFFATLGDQRWRRLLDRPDRAARAEVERFRGRFVKSTGDGVLAAFDAPTRALGGAVGLLLAWATWGWWWLVRRSTPVRSRSATTTSQDRRAHRGSGAWAGRRA
jgi:class 3 adenylate cyclase